jgi:hypothetical protein
MTIEAEPGAGTYGPEGSDAEQHPYTMLEQNFTSRIMQGRGSNRYSALLGSSPQTRPMVVLESHLEGIVIQGRADICLNQPASVGFVLRSFCDRVYEPSDTAPTHLPRLDVTRWTTLVTRYDRHRWEETAHGREQGI